MRENLLSGDNLINAIGIGIAVLTFIVERVITSYREKNNAKYNWFLTIIIEPHLEEIKDFYTETDKELRLACEDLKSKYNSLNDIEYKVLARKYCDSFKERRKLFFNNFVAMVSGFDKNISTEVDTIINNLDDSYVTAIDFVNENADSDGLLQEILMNKASLYQTLFKSISKKKYSYFSLITVFILVTLLISRIFT